MKCYIALILIFSVAVVPIVSANFVTDEIKKVVEDTIGAGVEKIAVKMDTFIMAEVKKVERRLYIAYAFMLLVNLLFSAGLIFATRRWLTK